MVTFIGFPTYAFPEIYTVSFLDGFISDYTADLLDLVPDGSTPKPPNLLPSWIKGGVNATLILHDMAKPSHRTLQPSSGVDWKFYTGYQTSLNGILLANLMAIGQACLDSGQLFQGHSKFPNFYGSRHQRLPQD